MWNVFWTEPAPLVQMIEGLSPIAPGIFFVTCKILQEGIQMLEEELKACREAGLLDVHMVCTCSIGHAA